MRHTAWDEERGLVGTCAHQGDFLHGDPGRFSCLRPMGLIPGEVLSSLLPIISLARCWIFQGLSFYLFPR